jgi:branched-chain amino acid transport system substrate-binding protein
VTGIRAALLVASATYDDPELRLLRAPAEDAVDLSKVLGDARIGGFTVRMVVDRPKHEVELEIEEFFADRRPDDLLVLYFSCHGIRRPLQPLYFATRTTQLNRLASTAVSSEWVNDRMAECRSKRIVVLLDCCYSGAFTKRFAAKAGRTVDVAERLQGNGRVVLTASEAMEYAFEDEQLKEGTGHRSLFTNAIVEGLKTGHADLDGDGDIAVTELHEYVLERLLPRQRPTISALQVSGPLYLARSVQGPRPLPAQPAAPGISDQGVVPSGNGTATRSPESRLARVFMLLTVLVLLGVVIAMRAEGRNVGGRAACNDQFSCVVYKPGEPVKIATLLATTGEDQELGIDSQRGVQLAVDYLDGRFDNKPGLILGHPVQLVNRSEGCSQQGGQTEATRLADDPTVLAVIGTSCTSAAFGVADKILSEKGVLLISPSNTDPSLTAEATHRAFYLRTSHNDRIQGAVVADFGYHQLKARVAAMVHDESPYSEELAEAFRQNFEKLGGIVTDNKIINSDDTDFEPVLTSIAPHRPDFLYYPVFNPACAQIAKQARALRAFAKSKLIGADSCADAEYVKVGGKAVNGTWISVPEETVQASKNAAYSQQFLAAYQQQFGTQPVSEFHAHAFDGVQLVFEAIKRATTNSRGTLIIPRTRLKDEMFKTSGYKGLTGTLTCSPLGDCAAAVSIAVYKVPAWPIEGGTTNPEPVFTETKTDPGRG